MSNKNDKITIGCGGLSFPIFLIFLVLKLTGTVTWSWWIITCPLWIPVCMFALFLMFLGVCVLIAAIIAAME